MLLRIGLIILAINIIVKDIETRIPAVEIGAQEVYNRHVLFMFFFYVLLAKEFSAMNADHFNPSPASLPQDAMLLLAREQEWAEAYAADHPDCDLAHVYLRFLRDEMARLLGEA